MAEIRAKLKKFHTKISEDLQRTVDFWTQYSHDKEFGGFLNCLDEDGAVYDETKHTWLQSRQVYMYASLLRKTPDVFKDKEAILQTAEKGADFLIQEVKNKETFRYPISTTRDGRAIKYQKSIFTEIFVTMALLELYEVSKKEIYKTEGLALMDKIIYWTHTDDTDLGKPQLAGVTPCQPLGVPLVLLLLGQLPLPAETAEKYKEVEANSVIKLKKHIQRNGSVILENISLDGKELPGSSGRLVNPGHAIECGWFLLEYAQKINDKDLQKVAIEKFIMMLFNSSWDEKHKGMFYFLDADNYSPTQLEWDMKLWWAHCEALIAFLMAWNLTRDDQYLKHFETVFDYCYEHFVDSKAGGWYGYLNRAGEITHRFKGGPWKGFFHVPRCLMMCRLLLEENLKE